ncbi:MAG: glycine cleavage system protein GcvH [Candidatus Bathyarchaeia archaeon]
MAEEYEIRATLYYTSADTWAKVMADGTVKVGITDYAQKMLREVVVIELPKVGSEVKQMEPFGSIESVKAVSDLISPLSGYVKEVNERVIKDPSLVNRDPYETGWMMMITPKNLEQELTNLINAEAYKKLIKEKKKV